eukprot:m.11764 g.11764  ORF g.11764 m.11764 type:complete len:143 (-) comp7038_c0_seq1:203-631(-)
MNQLLFEEMFTVSDIDIDGKQFDRVSRMVCQAVTMDTELVLDVNTQLYPLEVNDRITFCLADTLDYDGAPDSGEYNQSRDASLADRYEYVMNGIIYNIEEKDNALSVYASFGGLLMRLKGSKSSLVKDGIELDKSIYLLIRK